MAGIHFLVITLLVIFALVLFARAAAIALEMTGLDKKRALFHTLSAFSRTGFTTKEAESIVNHPVRRMIIIWLMILGTAGFATVIITATSHFVTSEGYQLPIDFLILLVGIYLIYKVATHKAFIRRWERFIEVKLIKSPSFAWKGQIEGHFHLSEGNGLVRVIITEKYPFIGNSLSESGLTEKGLQVQSIERGKNWIPLPKAEERIQKGDRIVVYGPLEVLSGLIRDGRNEV